MAASLELTPKQILSNQPLLMDLPAGTRVYITDLGGGNATAIAAARALAHLALTPVPHLAARRVVSRVDFSQTLATLAGDAGVREALVIAGGVGAPAGPFASTIDLLETGLFDAHNFSHIAVAGHPEGSPDIADADLAQALGLKQALAQRSDARFRIVTQFGFDVDRLVGWARRLKADGIDLPIHAGVAGPATVTTLLKYAAICGVGASLGFLRRRAGTLAALATSYSPDSFVEPLEHWQARSSQGNIAQIHVFPFGGIDKTIAWLRARGSLEAKHADLAEAEVSQ
ncbi:MAG: methylenetetrahydrofolate reductase [Alphaproteobacteria bacterium]